MISDLNASVPIEAITPSENRLYYWICGGSADCNVKSVLAHSAS